MKVSRDKKKEIRRDLIQAAVELFSERGFQKATMREISSKAGYGTATIYNYFSSKEKILYGYFEEKQSEVVQSIDDIPGFDEFTLKEKLQTQLETLLDRYLEDREFVQEAYKLIFDSPLRTFSEIRPVKKFFLKRVEEFFDEAVTAGEIPELIFPGFITNLYWDYTALIIFYWLKDDSTGFSNTSVLIDLSLDIIIAIFQSDIISRTTDMLSFLFKSHIFGNIVNIQEMLQKIREVHNKVMTSQEDPVA